MSFWDDVLQYGPAILGGGVGFALGGPGGAAIGAGLGGTAGNMLRGPGGDDAMARYESLMNSMPKYQGPQPGQGLTPSDMAAFDAAKQQASGVSRAREQALIGSDVARSGGASNSGKLLSASLQTGQVGMDRLHAMDMGVGAEAADRDRQNRIMLNDFNQRNMMMRAGITGSMADLSERQDNASRQNFQGLMNGIGNAGLMKYFSDSKLYKGGVPNSPGVASGDYSPEASEGVPSGGGNPMAQTDPGLGDYEDDPRKRVV